MKKLFFSISFLLTAITTSAAIAQVTNVVVTGTRYSGGASPSGSAVSYSYTNYASIAAGKSAAEAMAAAVKAKWCAEQKANLPGAILQCKTDAGRVFSDALRYTCNGETSRTIQGGITVYAFGGTISSTTSCSAVYSAEMTTQQSRCESDGFKVGRALEEQCK